VVIGTVGTGEVLGWSWLFAPYYWMFEARAVTPVRAIFFYGSRLREQCETDHELGYQMMKRTSEVVIGRLQATRRRLLEP
jgi:CRP/FNR family cyclic AMP-dependent transcriptional regulator